MRDKIIFLAKHVFSNDTEISHSSFMDSAQFAKNDFAMFDRLPISTNQPARQQYRVVAS